MVQLLENTWQDEELETDSFKETAHVAEKLETEKRLERLTEFLKIGAFAKTKWIQLAELMKFFNPKPTEKIDGISPIGSMKPMFKLGESKPNPLIIALAILAVALIVAGFYALQQKSLQEQTAQKLVFAQQNQQELETTLGQVKVELAKQKEELQKISKDLEAANAKTVELEQVKVQYEQDKIRVQKYYENQMTTLKNEIVSKENRVKALESNIQTLKSSVEGTTLEGSANSLGYSASQKSSREMRISNAPKKLIRTPGKVISINQTHRFMLVSIGSKDVQIGQFIKIYRKEQLIGDGRIDRVYETLSAATIFSDDTLKRAEPGDNVFISVA